MLYVSKKTNKLLNNKNLLKNIQSNAQARMVVQIYFIYERQNCLFVLMMHGTDITGSNAQTLECTLFWQQHTASTSTVTVANLYSVESGINNYQMLFQSNFGKQSSVQQQPRQIGLQSQITMFDAFMHTSILNNVMFLIITSL